MSHNNKPTFDRTINNNNINPSNSSSSNLPAIIPPVNYTVAKIAENGPPPPLPSLSSHNLNKKGIVANNSNRKINLSSSNDDDYDDDDDHHVTGETIIIANTAKRLLEQQQSNSTVEVHHSNNNNDPLLVTSQFDIETDNSAAAPDGGKRFALLVAAAAPSSDTTKTDDGPQIIHKDTRWATDGRETWTTRTEFLLSVIGYAVDLANVWRFPYLAYKNGGGAFLIPYFTMLIFGALPMLYLELAVGQFYRQGTTLVWARATPIFKGVGYVSLLVSFYVSFYYNNLLGYALHYIFSSIHLTTPLPWTSCDPAWASPKCTAVVNLSHTDSEAHVPAAQEYFDRGIFKTQESKGFGDFGYIKWDLMACTGLAYLVLIFSLSRGVKSSGKVVYVTVILPYVLLLVLLIRGVMLPGAADGIRYYITPSFSRITSVTVWIEAAIQVFYSSGAGFGVHPTLASFTKGHYPILANTLITCICNCATSIFAGFVVFTYIGYMAHKTNTSIETVANDGPGLAFYVYPEAIGTLPLSHIWSILFFCMFFNLGIDSSLGGMESIVTGISDDWTCLNRFRHKRLLIVVGVHLVSYAASTVCSMSGGIYMLIWLDTFAAGMSLLIVALLEALCISYFYGGHKFARDVKQMCNQDIGIFWRFCWKFTVPVLSFGIIIGAFVTYPNPTYGGRSDAYPPWSITLGWLLCFSSAVAVPVFIINQFRKGRTWREKIALGITPMAEHDQLYECNFEYVPRFHIRHYLEL